MCKKFLNAPFNPPPQMWVYKIFKGDKTSFSFSDEAAYEDFCAKLFEASDSGQGRYGVFDIHYQIDSRELDKVVFFTWSVENVYPL